MKKALSMLLIVGWLLAIVPSSSHAQDDPQTLPADWKVVLYDVGAHEVEIIRPDGVETVTTPECFSAASTDPEYYTEWYRRHAAISPDYRFLVVGMTESMPGVLITDLQLGTCFQIPSPMGMTPDTVSLVNWSQSNRFVTDVAVFSPDGTQLAFSLGYLESADIGQIMIVDLVESPGAILRTVQWEGGQPLLDEWRADGITFFNGCFACSPPRISGRLNLLNPATGEIDQTDEFFMRFRQDTLALTGETLTAVAHPDYPLPDLAGWGGLTNMIVYASAEPKTETALFYALGEAYIRGSHPIWVLDGNAFVIRQTLVFRDGSTISLENSACPRVTVGTPAGWLMQVEGSAVHCEVVDGEIVSTPTGVELSGTAVFLRQSPLGATAAGEVVPQPFVENFRLSFCGDLAQAPRLGYASQKGHITTTSPQTLYSEPDTNSAAVGTFTTFEVVNGPFCADQDTVWWWLTTGEQTGWALERRGDQHLLALNCPDESSSQLQIGAEVVINGQALFTESVIYSRPIYCGKRLGEIANGQTLTVLDGPVCDGEHVWWLVDTQEQMGWIRESGE